MRYTEFKLYRNDKRPLTEGFTKGDLAETVWGAAVVAAFEKYPNPSNKGDILRIINGLDGNLSYTKTRADGLKSEITDEVLFVNKVNMAAHIEALRNIDKTITQIDKEIVGILQDANSQVKTAGLALQDIFANGIADQIQVGAEGGADQKGTKVDVSILHTDSQGKRIVKKLGYSLKTDTAGTGVMPVSQSPGVDKGSGGQVAFFKDIGIVDNIDDASLEEYKELDATLRAFVEKNASEGKLESIYEKELRALRRDNGGVKAFNKNIESAASQINKNIETNGEEASFFQDIVTFLEKHINRNDPDIKLLTFDKNGAYTTTVEQFAKNVKNLKIKAIANIKSNRLDIMAEHDEGADLVLRLRFVASGARFSGSTYRKSIKKKSVVSGKEVASGYELLRYKMYVETGPGYKNSAKIS